MSTEEVNKKIDELFTEYSNNTSLSEGHYDYLMDKEDFKDAVKELLKYLESK